MEAMVQPGKKATRGSNLIFGMMVIVAYISMLAGTDQPLPVGQLAVLIVLGIAYGLIGTLGWPVVERIGTRPVYAGYFAIQLVLGAAILNLSHAAGFVSLLLLPLAGHGAVHQSWRNTVLVAGLVVLAFIVAIVPLTGWLEATQIGMTSFLAGVVFAVVFTRIAVRAERDRSEMERLAIELAEANQKLRIYSVQVEELATTTERNRVAREIHDSLGHYLTVINMQLAAAQAVFDADHDRALDAVRKAQSMTQEGLAEVRRSVSALRSTASDERPLPDVLLPLIEECRSAGILADLTVVGTPRRLGLQAEHTLFRAAQEALTNIRKHAHASRADIRLEYVPDGPVRLHVQDNGVGSDTSSGGFGLLGLRERVQLLGGKVQTHSATGQGFQLDVEVPA